MKAPEDFMRLAIDEALKGTKATHPNPKVGAVLVSLNGEIVFAYHQKSGGPHAEVLVFEECKKLGINPKGATLYVTLEPCSHHGKTPPCADRIIKEGVKKVYYGCQDPFPKVSGGGIKKLYDAGVEVNGPLLESEAQSINEAWIYAHKKQKPWVALKMATSLDGRWTADNGDSKWITSEEARAHAHEIRSQVDLIVTTGATLRKDSPKLSARKADGSLYEFQPKVFVATQKPVSTLPQDWDSGIWTQELLSDFYREDIFSVLIECDPSFATKLMNENFVDEIHLYLGSRFLGGQGKGLEALSGGKLPGFEVRPNEIRFFESGDLFLKLRLS